jgi:ABC-type glycerol-3-phosphate transport system permease component
MKRNRIVEKGERSISLVSYTVTILFVIASLLPLIWMVNTSLKDNASIDAYPPKFLLAIPKTLTITLDYSGHEEQEKYYYEKEAMEATWYPWMANLRENIGEVIIIGIKDGQTLYKTKTISANFQAGQPLIVPSTLFNKKMMDIKLPMIKDKKLSKFIWFDSPKTAVGMEPNSNEGFSEEELSVKFSDFYSTAAIIEGKIYSIEQTTNWVRVFDSYLSLNKVAEYAVGKFGFFRFFFNSAYVTVVSIAFQLVLGGLAGYAISQLVPNKKLQLWLVMFFLATIMIPDVSILLPLYFTMQKLNLIDSLWAVILPHTAWGIVIFLFKGFFDNQLSHELLQAARIDGASELGIFTRIVLPMSIPIFATVAIMTFVPVWNQFMWPLIVTKSPENWVFTVALNDLQTRPSVRQNTIMASAAVSMIPLLIVFSTSQRYIERGINFTGVKG